MIMTDSNFDVIKIIFLVLILVVFVIVGVIASIIIYYANFIKKHNNVYLKIKDLSKELNLRTINNKFSIISEQYDNEKQFYELKIKEYLLYLINSNINYFKSLLNDVEYNIKLMNEYNKKIDEYSNNLNSWNVDKIPLFKKVLFSLTKSIIDKEISKTKPVTQLSVCIVIYLTDLHNSRCFNKKCATYNGNDIKECINLLSNKDGKYYRDINVWNALCKIERSFVTNKLRFQIYDRDDHRCLKCGVKDNGSNLEIDHIKPISKGGKSTPDNLQTLCHDCNYEKGNKTIDYRKIKQNT